MHLATAWHAEAHGSLRGWLGAAGSTFPSHKVRVVYPMPLSASVAKPPWGLPEPVTCTEAFSCPILRAPDDGPSLVARLKLPSAAPSRSQDVASRTHACDSEPTCRPFEAHDSPWGWPGAAAWIEALSHPSSQGARGLPEACPLARSPHRPHPPPGGGPNLHPQVEQPHVAVLTRTHRWSNASHLAGPGLTPCGSAHALQPLPVCPTGCFAFASPGYGLGVASPRGGGAG